MEFLLEILLEIIGGVAEGVVDSEIKVKSKVGKVLAAICLLAMVGFFGFLTVVFAIIIFSNEEDNGFKFFLVCLEVLFVWYIVHIIRKVIKLYKNRKNEIIDDSGKGDSAETILLNGEEYDDSSN